MANAHTLQLKHKKSVPRLCQVLDRNQHYGSEIYTATATEHPQLGIFS